MTLHLSVEQVLELHRLQLEKFGGAGGLRDRGALEAAVFRPQATFDGDDLYPDLASKAAALLHSVVQNHAFVDGNKRVGAMAAELFLLVNEQAIEAADDELETLVLKIASGELSAEAVAIWIRQRARAL